MSDDNEEVEEEGKKNQNKKRTDEWTENKQQKMAMKMETIAVQLYYSDRSEKKERWLHETNNIIND